MSFDTFLDALDAATLVTHLHKGGAAAGGCGGSAAPPPTVESAISSNIARTHLQVSVLLYTVTFYANRAHNLTRSP
jgi:hypothetical protein